jgi:hypothetical protein
MNKKQIYIGNQKSQINEASVKGDFVDINNETFYKISNYDQMAPFLISIVSATDHWMFISSRGGLTAGRRNPDNALFPYVTDDKLHDSNEFTGNKTIIKIFDAKKIYLWEPFSERYEDVYSVSRNLYKNICGTKIIFEEINNDFNLIFTYSWSASEKYGFVKHSKLLNNSKRQRNIEVLDGIQNILPSGLNLQIQTEYSTLVDGYKKNELIKRTGLALFTLSSIPSDLAQPSESLTATTVCNTGIKVNTILLSSKQIDKFRKNLPLENEISSKGIRGSYFIKSQFKLKHKEFADWYIIAEVNQNSADVIELNKSLQNKNFKSSVADDIQKSQSSLKKIVAQADGLQLSGNKLLAARHFSNVLFNIMRGGIFDDSYSVDKDDFINFIEQANPFVLKAHDDFLKNLPKKILHSDLVNLVQQKSDPHFTRLAMEYLPLTFSRRHGDPSRPWNKFSIEVKNEKGEKILNYQGNWRDIFQNWEALALSYPKFLESMISKFLNTSTADGYNPYRISRDGFDWEIKEPHNPWANIGYWGDHQIIYLLKLLELSIQFNPHSLEKILNNEIFTFANVPYRIKEYKEILNDPRNTIEFDSELDHKLKYEAKIYGTDTMFLKKQDNTLVQVNLLEKLLITLLVKMSNFIPGGGIWMNTQRPEWNDANNALVGYGVSMVTLFYIRRYLNFLKEFLKTSPIEIFSLSIDTITLFNKIYSVFNELKENKNGFNNDAERKMIVDQLGIAGSEYRTKIYKKGFSTEKNEIILQRILEFADLCLFAIDKTIASNKRNDGLYHSYNIMHISKSEMKISHLYEMLEGQVAALSSGYLSVEESIDLLNSLMKSKLYRKDQKSFMLYPNKELPSFLEKNNISKELLKRSKLLSTLLFIGNKDIIYKDCEGGIHFQSDLINAQELRRKLMSLNLMEMKKFPDDEIDIVMDIYEKTFRHSEFTGRANTFYKYEGLGSIYWHMVSKLLLAVQEVYFYAEKISSKKDQLKKLKNFYLHIKDGIGVSKQPNEYGAFPIDPHSHTPSFAGAQQPGMTGQVKEDIISRFKEICIHIEAGKILFNTSLLQKDEFLNDKEIFYYHDLNGIEESIKCDNNSFAFTYCQVPFIYRLSDRTEVVLHKKDKKQIISKKLEIEEKVSQQIFSRNGEIKKVEILIKKDLLSG